VTACSQGNEDDEYSLSQSAEVTSGDFIYRIATKKETYQEGEPVELYSELEYIGEQAEVTIFHAASPFYFPMEETTRGYTIDYPMEEPLITTVLKKGVPFRQAYGKAGGYSETDEKEYVDFMKKLLNEEGFPSGNYEVLGFADFFIETEVDKKIDYNLKAKIGFKVEK
jgi:hypothetical protein